MPKVEDLILAYEIITSDDLGRCCHETLESRRGACDGGLRCSRNAVWIIEGLAYCDKHPSRDIAKIGQIQYQETHRAVLAEAAKLVQEIRGYGMEA